MKLLKVYFDHLKMFENGTLEIDLYAADKVPSSDESAFRLDGSLYSNNLVALAGINASGKTTTLNLIDLACDIINGAPINQSGLSNQMPGLFDGETMFRCAFHHGKGVYLIESHIGANSPTLSHTAGEGFRFQEETLSFVPISNFKKMMLRDWDALRVAAKRVACRSDVEAPWSTFLSDDMSIVAPALASAVGGRVHVATFWDMGRPRFAETDSGSLADIMRVFDQRIERFEVGDNGRVFALGFKGREPMVLSTDGLNEILSSGTLRGLALVQQSALALKHGGYLFADELENHLNRQLVNVVIDLFASASTNPHGATLVFTTHYPQLLDSVHRKDNVYFLARGELGGMAPVKYSDRVNRIENKKSEVFASNFIKGTAPRYTDVNALKAIVRKSVVDE